MIYQKFSQSSFVISNLPEEIRTYFAKSEIDNKKINVVFSVGNSNDNDISQISSGIVLTCLSDEGITINTEIIAYPIQNVQIY